MVGWEWLLVAALVSSGLSVIVAALVLRRWKSNAVLRKGFWLGGDHFTVLHDYTEGDFDEGPRAWRGIAGGWPT